MGPIRWHLSAPVPNTWDVTFRTSAEAPSGGEWLDLEPFADATFWIDLPLEPEGERPTITITPRFHEAQPVYDDRKAMLFIHEMTGVPKADVEKFMIQKNVFEWGMGFTPEQPDDLDFWGETLESVRARSAGFFPKEKIAAREIDPVLQRRFIARETGLDESVIGEMQAAEREYQIRAGILVQVPCDDGDTAVDVDEKLRKQPKED